MLRTTQITRGKLLPQQLAARHLLYAPSQRVHTTTFVTPVVDHWLDFTYKHGNLNVLLHNP